jgi:O-antigen ligase/polysaccharide polymerase Wzy-like membrane protein
MRLPPIAPMSSQARRQPALLPEVLLWLPAAGVALGQPFVTPGISVADVCLALFAAAALIARGKRRPPPPWPSWAPWLAAFCAWALLGGLWFTVRGEPGFSFAEFAKSAAKLLFYSTAAAALAVVLRQETGERAQRVVLWSFAAAGAVAVALYAAMVAGIPQARELVCGQSDWCNAAYYYERRWFGDSSPRGLREGVFVRAVGLAGEPSRLGLLMSLALGYLLLGTRGAWRHPWPLALIGAAAVLSFSLGAYALLVPVLALAGWRLLGEEKRVRRGAALAALAVVAGFAAVPPVRATLEGPIGRRAHRFLSGQGGDESARLRLLGSWDLALALVDRHPLEGIGLGHFDRRVPEIKDRLPGGKALDENVQGWNALAYVLATTGAVGLLLFVLFCYEALRGSPALALVFLVGMFADGTVLGPAFWVFLALYASAGTGQAGGPVSEARPG